ncbi:Uridine nucleosidase 1 [Aphelenchoides fujianensis]|nr:Uridine nucleosidase 1 [Aphelenchoides fujianensis]
MPKTKIVIDSDGVADDVRAISLALQHPDVEVNKQGARFGFICAIKVLAIISVSGCVSTEQAIPLYKGSAKPLIASGRTDKEPVFFGADGLGDSPSEWPEVLPDDPKAADSNEHAASALIRLFSAHKGEIQLVCIGPLTNVALALKLEPEFAKWAQKLVVMGGNVHAMGNVRVSSTSEFNFGHDPEAAHIVIKEMECEVVLIPWETFLQESSKKSVDFHAHLSLDVSLAKFFELATRTGRRILEKAGQQFAFCDEIAVGVAIDAERMIVSSRKLKGAVDGQMALAWMDGQSDDLDCPMRELTFVMEYNVQLLDRMVFDAIEHSATRRAISNSLFV